MKIVVVIPAFDEANHIRQVIEVIPRQVLDGHDVFIVTIDDGSSDSTAATAKRAGSDWVVEHKVNRGVAQAFMTAIKTALGLGADIIVNIDADGQFDPAEIPALVQPIIQGEADVVLGSRFVSRSGCQVPVVKRVGNLIIGWIVSILTGQRFKDTQCGFRALSREAAENLEISGFFTYTQEMILDVAFRGLRIVEVPISVRYYKNRKSRVVKNIMSYTLRVLGIVSLALARQFGKPVLAFLFGTSIFSVLVWLLAIPH